MNLLSLHVSRRKKGPEWMTSTCWSDSCGLVEPRSEPNCSRSVAWFWSVANGRPQLPKLVGLPCWYTLIYNKWLRNVLVANILYLVFWHALTFHPLRSAKQKPTDSVLSCSDKKSSKHLPSSFVLSGEIPAYKRRNNHEGRFFWKLVLYISRLYTLKLLRLSSEKMAPFHP